MENIFVSAITHKRPEGLRSLLAGLMTQKVDADLNVSIFIIDNDCTGQNQKVVDEFKNSPFHVTLVAEPEKGIVPARNKAVETFLNGNYDALVFIDDDEWPAKPNWLQNLIEAQRQTNADIVTSYVISQPEDESIAWTTNVLRRRNKFSKRNLQTTRRFYTNNLLVTRPVLQKVHPAFDMRFRHTGSSDLFFCLNANKAGFKAVYTTEAPVIEIFPVSRANFKWFFLRGYRTGAGATRSEIFLNHTPRAYFKCFVYGCGRTTKSLGYIVAGLLPPKKGNIAHALFRLGSGLGTFTGMLGMNYEEYKTTHGK